MRIAISRLALPLFGRPTRRARLSSWSVDSGISEKSIRLSGICFALFSAPLARTDDANCFRATFQPPQRVNNQKNSALTGHPKPFPATLGVRVFKVFPIESIWVGRCLFKRDAMLLMV